MSDEIVSIIGGGWSVRDIDFDRVPGTIIAVNDSAIYAPRCDIVVSMDRLWTEYRFPQLREMRKPAWLRRSAVQNVEQKFPWLHVFECDHESTEFVDAPDMLNGTNSGFCAFNLAYQMRPKMIALFGFDHRRSPDGKNHWFEEYDWTKKGRGVTSNSKYQGWSAGYKMASKLCEKAGILVLNVSPTSAITSFQRVSFSQCLEIVSRRTSCRLVMHPVEA